MKKNPGAVVYKNKIEQMAIDAAIDRKLGREPVNVADPKVMPSGARRWIFK